MQYRPKERATSAKVAPARGLAQHARHTVTNGSEVGRRSPFLTLAEVAVRLRMSERTVRELTRSNRVPHLKLPGARRCLFREDWLRAWESGAKLETTFPANGGKIVQPLTPDCSPVSDGRSRR